MVLGERDEYLIFVYVGMFMGKKWYKVFFLEESKVDVRIFHPIIVLYFLGEIRSYL